MTFRGTGTVEAGGSRERTPTDGGAMYEKPRVERLGSLRELTQQTTKWLNFSDGIILGDTNDNVGNRS
jgi:hypothetical protein